MPGLAGEGARLGTRQPEAHPDVPGLQSLPPQQE
jgi:hypothetical protein